MCSMVYTLLPYLSPKLPSGSRQCYYGEFQVLRMNLRMATIATASYSLETDAGKHEYNVF